MVNLAFMNGVDIEVLIFMICIGASSLFFIVSAKKEDQKRKEKVDLSHT
jgi:hypothetical protein